MITRWLAAAAVLAWASAGRAEDAPASTEAIGRAFVDILFGQHDFKRAYALYGAPNLIQHDPEIADGPDGDAKFFAERRRKDPAHFLPESQWRDVIDHFIVQGDLFVVHHHVVTGPADRGRVFVDIFRVEAGKIAEHWDVIQPVPAKSVNGHTMW